MIDPEIGLLLSDNMATSLSDTERLKRSKAFALCVSIHNDGPGELRPDGVIAVSRTGRKGSTGVPFPCADYPNDLSTPAAFNKDLATPISEGDYRNVFYPLNSDWIIDDQYPLIGATDSLERLHLVNGKAHKKVVDTIKTLRNIQ